MIDERWKALLAKPAPQPQESGEALLLTLYAAIDQRPELEGSEKQIAWADQIRDRFAKQFRATIAEELYKARSQGKDAEKRKRFLANRYTSAATLMFANKRSAEWINWRNMSLEDILRQVRKSRDFWRGVSSMAAADTFKEKLHGRE